MDPSFLLTQLQKNRMNSFFNSIIVKTGLELWNTDIFTFLCVTFMFLILLEYN